MGLAAGATKCSSEILNINIYKTSFLLDANTKTSNKSFKPGFEEGAFFFPKGRKGGERNIQDKNYHGEETNWRGHFKGSFCKGGI